MFGKFFVKFRLDIVKQSDERIRLMHEIIKGIQVFFKVCIILMFHTEINTFIINIQVIKMYVWEKCFEKTVFEVRKKELSALLKCSQIRGYIMNFMLIIERATLFITLIVYTLLGNPITASVVSNEKKLSKISTLNSLLIF